MLEIEYSDSEICTFVNAIFDDDKCSLDQVSRKRIMINHTDDALRDKSIFIAQDSKNLKPRN